MGLVGYPRLRPGKRLLPIAPVAAAAAPTTYDLTSYYAAMSVQPDASRKALLQALADGLQSDGVMPLLDAIYILAAHDEQAGRVNLVNPNNVATGTGTLYFTADRGFASDAATGYLETGIADNAAGNWSRNTASMFIWLNRVFVFGAAGTAFGLSGAAGTRIQPQVAASPSGRLHAGTTVSGVAGSSKGLITFVRTDSTTLRVDQDGVAGTPTATTAAAVQTADTFQICHGSGSYCDCQFGAAGKGGVLTAAQSLALYSRLNTYLTAIGGA